MTAPSGTHTHADTIRALREKAMQATIAVYKETRGRVPVADAERLADRLASLGLDALAALDALVAERDRALAALQHFRECADTPLMRDVMDERDRERARADRAEAALHDVVAFIDEGENDSAYGAARAALSAGSSGREPT